MVDGAGSIEFQRIGPGPALDRRVSGPEAEVVVTLAAVRGVVAQKRDAVVATPSFDEIVALTAVERVGTSVTVDRVAVVRADDVLDGDEGIGPGTIAAPRAPARFPGRQIDPDTPAFGRIFELAVVRTRRGGGIGGGIDACAAVQQVVAAAAMEQVVAVPAVERVPTVPAVEQVVAGGPVHRRHREAIAAGVHRAVRAEDHGELQIRLRRRVRDGAEGLRDLGIGARRVPQAHRLDLA